MKLLRLYFLGFLLSLDASVALHYLKEEVAIAFSDNLQEIYADMMSNEYIVQGILSLQA